MIYYTTSTLLAYLRRVPPTRIGHVSKTLNVDIPSNVWVNQVIYIADIYDPSDYLTVDLRMRFNRGKVVAYSKNYL